MLDGIIVRGTTPTYAYPLPEGVVSTDVVNYTISYRQKGSTVLVKRKFDTSLGEHKITVTLSQDETLLFNPLFGPVSVQLKIQTTDNSVRLGGRWRLRVEEIYDTEEFEEFDEVEEG